MITIPERDWRAIRAIKGRLLENFCERVFEKVGKIIQESSGGKHQAYLDVWRVIRRSQDCDHVQ